MKSNNIRSLFLWMMIASLAVLAFLQFQRQDRPEVLDLSEFIAYAQAGAIVETIDRGGKIEGKYEEPETQIQKDFSTEYRPGQAEMIAQLALDHGFSYKVDEPSQLGAQLLWSLLPILIIVGIMFFVLRQFQSGGNKAMSFGKSRARRVAEGETGVTFDDVAGCDEAKEELEEIVAFLKDPQKFTRLGAKIPKGVLLVGAPGTGKTLLARAVAGEAEVPFFSISGSDFVEMFVGVGAARVRDLFEQGKKSKPCLIFIDEIDAVGRQRGAGFGGGHDEREQTLNQLLVEMDGFDANEGVILIAATNRPDVLDTALLRPGRFDRQITVDVPDIRGREQILRIHARDKTLSDEVELERIARATPGFSGADLGNLLNEAALLAARCDRDSVEQQDLEEAKDRVLMGPERRSMVLNEKERELTACHEAGHAIAAYFHPDVDPVHKVTIIPRGRALGVTAVHSEEDRHGYAERQLKGVLVYALGGRSAELVQFDELSTGASNDLKRVTDLAHQMVCEYGMSRVLGSRTFGPNSHEVFLAREYSRDPTYSQETAGLIDQEVKRLIDEAQAQATDILEKHGDILQRVSEALLERETLDGKELTLLIKGKELPPLFDKPEEATKEDEEAAIEEPPEEVDDSVGEIKLKSRPGLSTS